MSKIFMNRQTVCYYATLRNQNQSFYGEIIVTSKELEYREKGLIIEHQGILRTRIELNLRGT